MGITYITYIMIKHLIFRNKLFKIDTCTCDLTIFESNIILETYIMHYDLPSLVGFDNILPHTLESGMPTEYPLER